MTEHPDRELAVFSVARRLPAGERAAYLGKACAGNEALRQRVDELLKAGEEAGSFLEGPASVSPGSGETVRLSSSPTEKTGDRIGRYKLLEQIGEGGCGVVYMAEQEEPVHRRVALKVIKLGMDTRSVIARFEAERQALALMDHPNIAKVLDAGATEAGRPYFVMELVHGVKITDYCDQNNLSTHERLEIFVQVCRAIQHAHQKGIIHRDIKPSNILVTMNDGVPLPKVIDFGIAKATHGKLTDKTLFTAFEQFIGTPAYMSPEQAEMSALDIDTRSDIYSLGVLLYELLTGQPPFDANKLLQGGLDEMRRAIREQEPAKPSTCLSTMLGADLTEIAKHRKAEPPRLIHLVRGDLDWIVMKALEKDRTRRYETANGLAVDIQRHLNNEPVAARPPSNFYKFQKLARRNKLAFAAASAVAAALVIGLGLSTWLLFREREASQRALAAERVAKTTGSRLATALNQMELGRAEDLFASGETSQALAHLARAVRQNPVNEVAAARLLSALTQRPLALPFTEPMRHHDLINSAHFSPDGLRVATASQDGTARIWDARTGGPLTEPLKCGGVVGLAKFSPDGKLVVTVSSDGFARIWDSYSGRQIVAPLKHPGSVLLAQFSPDGRMLVTGSRDGIARFWDVRTGLPLLAPLTLDAEVRIAQFSPDGRYVAFGAGTAARVFEVKTGQVVGAPLQHRSLVVAVEFSPDGQRIVTASDDTTARIWGAQTGRPKGEQIRHGNALMSAHFSPDGKRIVTASFDKTARIWDASTGQALSVPLRHGAQVESAQFSRDGQRVVTASDDKTARVWGTESGELLTEPMNHRAEVTAAEFSPDGQYVLTVAADNAARIWDVRGTVLRGAPALQHDGAVNSAQFSPDGQWVVTASDDGTARVWNANTGRPATKPMIQKARVLSAQFSADGQAIVTACEDGTARVWNTRNGEPLTDSLQDTARVASAQFSRNGLRVVTASWDGMARVWDARTGQPILKPLKQGGALNIAEFSPDGNFVVTASWDGTAQVWDADTCQSLTGPLEKLAVAPFAHFSPDGRKVVTASGDGKAWVWDARTGRSLFDPVKHDANIIFAEFSPDGECLVTASIDKTARVWNARTGQPITGPLAHKATVASAKFSPDGRRVVTASYDNTAQVWDARTGQPLAEPFRHSDAVLAAQFSPDGRRVVTASEDRTARVWEVPDASVPVPGWIAELTEAVAQKRFDEHDVLESVPPEKLLAIRRRFAGNTATDVWSKCARWLLVEADACTNSFQQQ